MDIQSVNALITETRDITLLSRENWGQTTEFSSYLEDAKVARAKLADQAERIKGDAAQAAKDHEAAKGSDEETVEEATAKFRAKKKTAFQRKKTVFEAQTVLPAAFQEQVAQTLMGGGQVERGVRAWELSGQERPSKVLKGLLDNISGQGKLWTMNRDCLPALGRIMLASGATAEQVAGMTAKLSQGPLTLDRVVKEVSQMESDLALAQSLGLSDLAASGEISPELASFMAENSLVSGQLTVTAAGVGAMGQYFLSLGLSQEAVKAVTADLAPGQTFSAQSLRDLLGKVEEPLAPLLNDGDTSELTLALKLMGANSESLTLFSQYLAQEPGAKLEDLVSFLAILDKPQTQSVSAANLVKDVQSLIAGSTLDSEVAKAPVFNEILLKLGSLGDRQLADDFAELSPALQALRGGISGLRAGGENLGDQGQRHSQEREKERLALSGVKSLTLNQGLEGSGFAQSLAAEMGGYGSRESLAKQLETKLIYSARHGIHRLKMDLDPEDLGRLDVELKVKNDKLTAHIRAETLEAYEALEQEISSLKASLAESGLEMTLTLSFEGQEAKDRHFSRSRDHSSQTASNTTEETDSSGLEPQLAASQRLFDRVI
ncbi:MAG: flagellar hook-length control protein FliK [Deltaproteobacteria bacterium]|jgi:hypothetical protein|nr:flagellar hook-length control protein FliK [Deltaproteobacteria bacterium]